jgi:hypothetical protein
MVLLISLGQVIRLTDLGLDIDCETWDMSFKKREISNALDGTEHVVFGKKVTSYKTILMTSVTGVIKFLGGSIMSRNFILYYHFVELVLMSLKCV